MTAPDGLAGDLRAWLEPLPPAVAARLIAEAREEAERIVRDRLVGAWTDVLLDGIQGALRAPPVTVGSTRQDAPAPGEPDQRQHAPAPDEPDQWQGVYVHCVVGRSHRPPAADLEGIEQGTRVAVIEHGDLTAVVSPVALTDYDEDALRDNLADLTWLERVARAHERVQREVARDGTPIPMRLCTIYRDGDGVREMLAREHTALAAALAHLDGRTEWGIQAFAHPDAPVAPPAEGDRAAAPAASPGGGGEGASYLRAQLTAREERDRSRQRLDEVCLELHRQLAGATVDAVLSAPQRPEASGHPWPMILNGAYLVADADVAAFDEAVREVVVRAQQHGIEIRRTGPWPPYNFVPGAIGAAW